MVHKWLNHDVLQIGPGLLQELKAQVLCVLAG